MSDLASVNSKNKLSYPKVIGFREGLLSDEPLRMDVLANSADFIALNKPANISLRQHPWDENSTNLDTALNHQLKEEKPEILALGAESFGSIYFYEKAISGIALFSKHKAALTFLRNAFGSGLMEFKFQFIAQAEEGIEEYVINETPLIQHRYKFKMVPSTTKGKRSRTEFTCLKRGTDSWGLWQAKCNYFRPHQLRIHASLSGFQIMNDNLYCGVDAPTLASLGKCKKAGDVNSKIFTDLAINLNTLQFVSESSESIHLVAEPLQAFKTALNYLELK